MRVGRRRGVAEGVVIGAAIAGQRRPATVVVPTYPAPYYGVATAPSVVYASTPAPAQPSNIVINTGEKAPQPPPPAAYPPGYGYQQPPPMPPPAGYPYPPPAPVASVPPPYVPTAPAAPVVTTVEVVAPQPTIVTPPAAIAAGIGAAAVADAVERKRSLLIVNEANCSVLEIQRGNAKPNAAVVSNKRRPDRPACQVWYIDETGVIRSKLNDFAMEAKENGASLRMMPYTGDARQKWTFQNNKIVNEVFRNDCVGLKKGLLRLKDDADVVTGPYEGKPFQHWRIEYI